MVVHPDCERLAFRVGRGLPGFALCAAGADSQHLDAGFVQRGTSSTFRLAHRRNNIRPREVLTGEGFVGHNKGMTTSRNYEAELFAAFTADRTPGATASERTAASKLAQRIANQAAAAGTDLWAKFYDIDEAARLAIYA